jgi:hypothetical protein
MRLAQVAFPADALHTGYAQKLREAPQTYRFDILDPAKTVIEPGDIIVKNRDNSLTFASSRWTGTSHGDIVTTVSPNSATAIGGNLGDKVKQVTVSLKNGIIQDPNYFVVLRPPLNKDKIVEVAEEELKNWPAGLTDRSPLTVNILRRYYQVVGIKL